MMEIFSTAAAIGGALYSNWSSAQQASKQQDFQARQSETAHQREVADLRAAGLNPILSATGGPGAQSGSGASAPQSDPITPGINTALAVARTREELKNIDQDTRTKGSIEVNNDMQGKLAQQHAFNLSTAREGLELDNQIKRYSLPGHHTESEIDKSWYGTGTRYLDRLRTKFGNMGFDRPTHQSGSRSKK